MAMELWREIEEEFPVFSPKDIENLVRRHVGYVDFRKCVELAAKLAEEKPVRYRIVRDLARNCESFKDLEKNSFGKVLSRVLGYLEQSGLLIKTWSSRKAISYYFRIYRTVKPEKPDCGNCRLLRELEWLLNSYRSDSLRGSSVTQDSCEMV